MLLYFNFEDKNRYTFFSGISDMSAKLLKGVERAEIDFGKNEYTLNNANKEVRFPVHMKTRDSYTMDISLKVARDEALPAVDMHSFFQNGSSGIGLPVFAQ